MVNSKQVIHLAPSDNVLVICQHVKAGDVLTDANNSYTINSDIPLGHKIAQRDIAKGEKILKYNLSIGSATQNIKKGEHVHVHNMKSDFIPTYTIDS
jgi:altronate dehydratase